MWMLLRSGLLGLALTAPGVTNTWAQLPSPTDLPVVELLSRGTPVWVEFGSALERAAQDRAGPLQPLPALTERTESRATYLITGALVGAAAGAAVSAAFEQGYCDNDLYSECSANGVVPGLLVGGAAGLVAGWIVFEVRTGRRERGSTRFVHAGVQWRSPAPSRRRGGV
jgi:hypothetical protein